MGIPTPGHLTQLIDYVLRGWLVRIPHAEIDDVLAAMTSSHLELVHLIEYVRRQPIDARKIGTHGLKFDEHGKKGGANLPTALNGVKRVPGIIEIDL